MAEAELSLALPVEALAQALASRVAELVAERESPSPWLSKEEAIDYTRIAKGTFEKLAAEGRIPSHGGKTKVFNRHELDQALMRL